MNGLEYTLFLGFTSDASFEKLLAVANPHARALFIDNGSDYLHEISYRGQRYYGKMLGKSADLGQCALLEANIYSLLKKLVPSYPYVDCPLTVLPVPVTL